MMRKKRLIGLVLVFLFFPALGLIQQATGPSSSSADLSLAISQVQPQPLTEGPVSFCLGGPEFMAALAVDLAGAKTRALVQTLSFEGDAAGTALAEALIVCPAPDKGLIIDSYSRLVQSDQLVGSPVRLLNFGLYGERARMYELVQKMRDNGVDVVFGRPFGLKEDNFISRDHKKMCVVDDVAYVGGINFSDHNFRWRDLMLRVESATAAEALAEDFEISRAGRSENSSHVFDNLDLVIGKGSGDPAILTRMATSISQADSTIYLECPYITQPLFDMLAVARQRGVQVTIVTSEHINRFGMKWSILGACVENDLELRLWADGMTHIKAMLVDDQELMVGSANFDFLSGSLQPELLAVSRDPELIQQFNTRIKEPSLAGTWNWSETGQKPRLAPVGKAGIGLATEVLNWVHQRKLAPES